MLQYAGVMESSDFRFYNADFSFKDSKPSGKEWINPQSAISNLKS